MKLRDRPYQTEAVHSIWNYFLAGNTGNPVVAMPTGTGKSVVIARFLQSVFQAYPGQKVQVLTHVKELIAQNYQKLMMAWPFSPAGIYSAGLNQRDHNSAIIFAGIASVAKKWAMFGKVDLVIIDEAHLVSPADATMYQAYINGLRSINPMLKVIGLTATPWRLGHGHITEGSENKKGEFIPSLFTDVCFDITGMEAFNRLIAEGYLVPLVPKRTKVALDIDGVHMRGGEFIESELQLAVNKDDITWAALKEAMELGADRKKWLIFASGTDHADRIGEMLDMLGISNAVVHSKRAGRDQAIEDFKTGKIRAIVNNNVLTTGFDEPEIDLIICLRPTASAVLWVQMLGRGTRPFYVQPTIGHNGGPPMEYDLDTIAGRLAAIEESGKRNCLVLDYARNTSRLGPINDPVIPRKKGQKGGQAPVKTCQAIDPHTGDTCGIENHASVKYCGGEPYPTAKGCGAEFKFLTKIQMVAASDELLRGDMPVVELFKVDHIIYDIHEKRDRPDSVKVTYYCGLQSFTEYVCFEHNDFAGRKARQWWKRRTDMPFPMTSAEGLNTLVTLKNVAATHLKVWINKKYPEIMDVCLDGTAFGTQEPTGETPLVGNSTSKAPKREELYCLDDEIPF